MHSALIIVTIIINEKYNRNKPKEEPKEELVKMYYRFVLATLCASLLVAGCEDARLDSASVAEGSGRDARYDGDPDFSVDEIFHSPVGQGKRGLLDVRGLIHEHSPHSHDACDDQPMDSEGNFDVQCLRDFYDGLCRSAHDFVMLTDHPTYFSELPFPETLLYDAQRGDQLVMRGERPVANRISCDAGRYAMVLAGSESSAIMPVGIEAHVADPSAYDRLDVESVAMLEEQGAVVLLAHTEKYAGHILADLPITGFEMYNLHAALNTALEDGTAANLLAAILDPDETLYPDLVLLPILVESPLYLDAWAGALALGAHRVTTMGTDAHRNSLNIAMSDGERIDSWRRMNRWFSNHLLVPGNGGSDWSDLDLKSALRDGRLYGVFELLGYARGFEYYATAGGQSVEMGGSASLADGVTLRLEMPSVRGLGDAAQPPRRLRLLRATGDGWLELAQGDSELSLTIDEPGAYRAEVRIRPEHLRADLGSFAYLADEEFVWIYSNAIYVTE